jgi:oxysterol-binding protein 1
MVNYFFVVFISCTITKNPIFSSSSHPILIIMEIVREGTLQKWTNYIYGWKSRYFVLHDGLLEYCKQKGNPLKGKIALSTLEVKKHPKKDAELIIFTGVTKLHLKAQNPKEAQEWFVALKRAVTTEHSQSMSHIRHNESIDEKQPTTPLALKVSELWNVYALICEAIDCTPQGAWAKDPNFQKALGLCNTFKMMSSEIMSFLEGEELKIAQQRVPHSVYARNSVDFSDTSSIASPKHLEPIRKIEEECKGEESVEFEDAKSHASMEKEESYMPHRKSLPFLRNPNQKYNIWRVVKDSVGKELSKIAVPVYFNEPISFLQRFSEDVTYHEILLNACEVSDPVMRLAYVACFAVTSYVSSMQRTMKPFNPLLGETFELVRDGFRVISEQVSHHPPVSAIHCEHSKFTFWASVEIKTSFKGTHLNVQPKGHFNLKLLDTGDHFVWGKPQTNVHNIIFGKMYVDHFGKMEITNRTTGDSAILNFHKKGWFEKIVNEVTGTVSDRFGTAHYKLSGRWHSGMAVQDLHTGRSTQVWETIPYPEGYDHNYFFSDFAIQLNMPPEYFPGLPMTDSRFRPDQRALENGDLKLAGSEKNRVEEKQRAARKIREDSGEMYFPRWFRQEGEDWVYAGGYWEAREENNFGELQDIF